MAKKNHVLKTARYLKLSLVLLCAITMSVLAPINTRATVAGKDAGEVFQNEILSKIYYDSIAYCLHRSDLSSGLSKNSISENDAKNNDWFAANIGDEGGRDVPIGTYVPPVSGNNLGYYECNSSEFKKLMADAFKLWDVTPAQVLCNSGFYRTNHKNDSGAAEEKLKNCIDTQSVDFERDIGASLSTSTNFRDFIKRKVYDGSDVVLSDAQKYFLYRESLANSCIPGVNQHPTLSNNMSGEQIYHNVKWVSEKGKIEIGNYSGAMDKNSPIIIGIDENNNADQLSCEEAVTIMNVFADAYSKKAYELDAMGLTPIPPSVRIDSSSSGGGTTCNIDGVGWIICPVVRFLSSIADDAFKFISDSFLFVSPEIFNSSNPTYEAWKNMRSIANVLFIIAFLIVIFSQMSGIGLSNYDIKKILPRLVIAAILVNTSYYICQIAVDISNILGYSLKSALQGMIPPTGGTVSNSGWKSASGFPGFLGVTTGIIAAGALIWVNLAALIPILLAGIVALIVVLFILVARQALIILLVVASPIAMVCLLLPNTDPLFKKWQKAFTGLLIVFPTVGAVFGMSTLASGILNKAFASNTGDSTMGQIIAAAVMVLPLFLIPGILKKSIDSAGSIGARMSGLGDKLGGIVGKKGSEMYDRSSLARGREIRKQAKEAVKTRRWAESVTRGEAGGGSRMDRMRARFARGLSGIETRPTQRQREIAQAQRNAVMSKARNTVAAAEAESLKDAVQTMQRRVAEENDEDGFLEDQAINGTTASDRAAAMHLLASRGSDKQLRRLQARDPGDAEHHRSLKAAINANVGALISKAPDIVKGSEGAFTAVTADQFSKYSGDTARAYMEHLSNLNNAANATGASDSVKQTRDRAFGAFFTALSGVANTPQLATTFNNDAGMEVAKYLDREANNHTDNITNQLNSVTGLIDRSTGSIVTTQPTANHNRIIRP